MVVSYLLKGNDPIQRLMPVEEFYEQMRKIIPPYSKLFRPSASSWGDFWREGWKPTEAAIELLQMWQ